MFGLGVNEANLSPADGSIGILDMKTQAYEVVHRAHAAAITNSACCLMHEELVTVTEDGFIKIWNLSTMKQHTEFCSGIRIS